jgi:glycerol 2-dehydrogenase (NADP+)
MLEYHKTEVGQGIKASGVKREDIFLTTKLDNLDHTRPEEALQDSLKKLDTPYLDLCLCIYETKIAVILISQ